MPKAVRDSPAALRRAALQTVESAANLGYPGSALGYPGSASRKKAARDETGLGSYTTVQGLRRSARLVAMLTTADKPADIVDATLEDATDSPSVGGSRKRGGAKSETRVAIEELFAAIEANRVEAKKIFDKSVATSIRSIPYVIGTAAAVKAVQNVSVFGKIVSGIRAALGNGVVSMTRPEMAPYKKILTEIMSAMKTSGLIGRDMFAYVQNSPEAAVALAAIIMSYRALNSGKTIKQVMIDDATTIRDVLSATGQGVASAASAAFSTGMQVATGEIQAFNDAWQEEAGKKAADTLRSIGARIVKTPGEAAAAMKGEFAGEPAYQGPVDGEGMAVVRGLPGPPLADALRPRPIDPEARAAAALTAMAREPPVGMKEGGRRRKTKKRATKKRRMTRRKLTFSY